MRVLAAFDKFKDSFSAEQACSLVESTAGEFSPNVEVVSCPLTDGGEGFVDILTSKCRGDLIEVKARDSLGRPREAVVGMVPIDQLSNEVRSLLGLPESGKLAIIEMASVCGLGDLDLAQRDPLEYYNSWHWRPTPFWEGTKSRLYPSWHWGEFDK